MDSEENATSCSVCQEIYSDPRCLACGHSFCLKCLQGVAGNKQRFPCPICRFDVNLGYTNIDQLPKNFVLCNVIEALDNKHASMCLVHNKSLDLFCQRCDVVICSKCLTVQHTGHSIQDIDIIFIERNKQYGAFLERTKHLVLMTEKKRDTVKQLRISMEKNIDSISKTVENTFKKWNDALQKQHNAILSYLHQERDQKRQVFFEAERILEGSMTTVTGLGNEISKLRSKDTAYVVQQHGSIMARQEDTESMVLEDIETCFTSTDNLVLEVYSPWIEEAINNIKLVDMKQTQASSGRQKIAEIQEENFILKRECEKVRITLHELVERFDQLRAEHHNLKTAYTTLYERYKEAKSDEIKNNTTSKEYMGRQQTNPQPDQSQKQNLSDTIHENKNKTTSNGNNGQQETVPKSNRFQEQDLSDKIPEISEDEERRMKLINKLDTLGGQLKALEEEKKKLQDELSRKEITTLQLRDDRKRRPERPKSAYPTDHRDKGRPERPKSAYPINHRVQRHSKEEMQMKRKTFKKRRRTSWRKDLENTSRDLNEKIRKHEEDLERKIEKIKHLEAVKNDLMNRLSSEAAARMIYNNPNITDLSDQDKPTKISERYAELYDNQWIDAFQNLQKSYQLSDTKVIEVLLDVLYISFDVCKQIREQRQALVRYLTEYVGEAGGDVIVSEVMTILKGAKKKNIAKMHKDYAKVQEVLETKYSKVLQCIGPYVNECVELCLLMNIQDPALELHRVVLGENPLFDVAFFRPYTKSGSRIEHMVWPALYLCNNGPLLCRGVAQGMRDLSEGHKPTIISITQAKKNIKVIS